MSTADTIVRPSLLKMGTGMALGVLGILVGLYLIFGAGMILTAAALVLAVLVALMLSSAWISGKPCLILTPAGFSIESPLGAKHHPWRDIDGSFEMVQLGFRRVVGFKLVPADANKKPGAYLGFDGVVGGVYALSVSELADLLNERLQQWRTQSKTV